MLDHIKDPVNRFSEKTFQNITRTSHLNEWTSSCTSPRNHCYYL